MVDRNWFSGTKPQKKKTKGFGRGKKVRARNKRRERFAARLNKNLPKSEQWFMSLYKDYMEADDEVNVPLGMYIPDIRNMRLKYFIEIDGSIHRLARIRKKDMQKNIYYKERGFYVYRINAYDEKGFILLMAAMKKQTHNQNEIDRKLRVETYLKSLNN